MKACLYTGVEQMEVREVERPPRLENEVTIEVARAGLCGTDLHVYLGDMSHRVTPPRVLGHEMVGAIVEAPEQDRIRVGDRVVVEPTARGLSPTTGTFQWIGFTRCPIRSTMWPAP